MTRIVTVTRTNIVLCVKVKLDGSLVTNGTMLSAKMEADQFNDSWAQLMNGLNLRHRLNYCAFNLCIHCSRYTDSDIDNNLYIGVLGCCSSLYPGVVTSGN